MSVAPITPAASDYFLRITRKTQNRMWVNNPTLDEARWAVEHGAVACTTNPTYASRMIRDQPEVAEPILRQALAETGGDIDAAADRAQQLFVARLLETFRPIYEATEGRLGYVSIQGDPRADTDAQHILDEARAYRELGPNIIPKIPAIPSGLTAIETLTAEDVPTIATEVFAVTQAIDTAERYLKVVKSSGKSPVLVLTHITGIFDEYLGQVVKEQGIDVDAADLFHAGCAVARKQLDRLGDRADEVILLGGGVRGDHHFTEMIDSPYHVTMNWSTIEELLEKSPPIEDRFANEVPDEVIERLRAALPDFRKAYDDDGITADEYAEYGPVQFFRDKFIAGWDKLLQALEARKK